jgi:hypothetical protein
MDLIRAYADKVAGYLPRNARVEAADELYDSLAEQFAEQALEGDDAQAKFLGAQPHPIKMATRMGENESLYLIGPTYYLSFIAAIKVAAVIVAIVHVGLFGLAAWGSGSVVQIFMQTAFSYPGNLLNVIVMIGLVFVVLEKTGQHAEWLDNWDVGDLVSQFKHNRISRFESLFELNVSAVVLLWLTDVVEMPAVIRHDGVWITDFVSAAPQTLITFIVILLALDIVNSVLKLIRGFWTPTLRVLSVVSNTVWLVALGYLLQLDPLVLLPTAAQQAEFADILAVVNRGIDVVLILIMIIAAGDIAKQLYRLAVKP